MINLIPHNLKSERLYGRRNRILIGYIVALITAAVLVALTMLISIRFVGSEETSLKKTIDDNQIQITALESQIKDLSSVSSRLSTADKLYENNIEFSKLIPDIGSLLPQGTILNSLSLTGGNTDPLSLDVDLLNADLAAVLQRNLVNSELFEAADINSISGKSGASNYRFTASVSVSFTGSAEAKRKVAAAAAAAAEAAAAEKESENGDNQ
jgi:Tfp pilus assembly protein PilN